MTDPLKQWIGIGTFDLVVQAVVTLSFMAFVAMTGGPEAFLPGIIGGSALVLAWRRSRALAKAPVEGLTTGELHLERMEELEQRVAEVEILHARVAELEERLDFSERLLVHQPSPRELAEGWVSRLEGGLR